jgi:precorrin-6B C5,15-methyltransferase / cobalt-precorrin-6B C5,C15-methyltransferase
LKRFDGYCHNNRVRYIAEMKKTPPPTTQRLPIVIIGMGMSPDDLTAAHLRLIEAADLLIGGRRHLSLFKDSVPETYEVTADLTNLVATIQGRSPGKHIVVLASGDPLYYGIGAYLVRSLGMANVRIYPNITSVAAAFARIGEPWQDVRVVSLHGRRQEDQLRQALRTANRIAVFTDPNCTPQWVGDLLRLSHAQDFQIGVFENMGSAAEQVSWHTTESIAGKDFNTPNMVILKRVGEAHCPSTALHLGMPESAFDHERGLITKAEVRVVSLARLSLLPGQILWDLGAGSGAVSIEASLLVPGGQIWAVEKNPARIEQIRINRDRFGITNLNVVESVLPRGLSNLPDPDRVFIGGSGEALAETINVVCPRLPAAGVLVVNTVLMDSLHDTLRRLRSNGLDTDVVQIQVSRSQPLADSDRMRAMNPVWIIRGHRASPPEDRTDATGG